MALFAKGFIVNSRMIMRQSALETKVISVPKKDRIEKDSVEPFLLFCKENGINGGGTRLLH